METYPVGQFIKISDDRVGIITDSFVGRSNDIWYGMWFGRTHSDSNRPVIETLKGRSDWERLP